MTEQANPDLARALLIDAGFADEDIFIKQAGPGWLVSVRGLGSGATDGTDETMDTPQEVAEAIAAAFAERAAPVPIDDYGGGAEPVLTATFGDGLEAKLVDEPEAETTFVFGDHLPTDRLVRQGQVADHAARLIAEMRELVNWDNAEFAAAQSHVVTHMNQATGAYMGGNAGLYDRFVTLSEAQNRIRAIEAVRDEKIDFLLIADREAVVTFDYEAGWP